VKGEQGFTSVSTEAGTAQRQSRTVDAERDGPNMVLLITQADCPQARTPEFDNITPALTRQKRLALPQAKGR
jgi:hypothetical protein